MMLLNKAAALFGSIIIQLNGKSEQSEKPLSIGSSGSKVRTTWKTVKSALFKKGDVARFQEQLHDRRSTINLSITTAQM